MNSNAYGIFSKVPPEERLVAEERDCWAHARAARELPVPERLPGTERGPVILRAIDIIIDLGPDLERNKRDRRALRPSGRGLGGWRELHTAARATSDASAAQTTLATPGHV